MNLDDGRAHRLADIKLDSYHPLAAHRSGVDVLDAGDLAHDAFEWFDGE